MDEERTTGPDRSERARVLLARIAELLRVDPSFFLASDVARDAADVDATELLQVFRSISDPVLRRSVIAMLRDLERDKDGTGES